MKKFLTVPLAIVALAVLTGIAAGQEAQQKGKQTNPPTSGATKPTSPPPKPPTTIDGSRSNTFRLATKVMKGTVTEVDEKKKEFTVKGEDGKVSTFLGAELKALPTPAQFVEVTYTETAGVLKATTITVLTSKAFYQKTTEQKSVAGGIIELPSAGYRKVTGRVTKLNETDNTFTVTSDGKEGKVSRATALKTAELKRSPSGLPTIKELKAFLESGELVEVTYTENPGEPPMAKAIKGSKSNNSERVADRTPKMVTGKVVEVKYDKRFAIITANAERITFDANAMKDPLPKLWEFVDVSYTQSPGEPPAAITVRGSKMNSSERAAQPPSKITGKVVRVESNTFTITTKSGEIALSTRLLKTALPLVGAIVDVTFTLGDPASRLARSISIPRVATTI